MERKSDAVLLIVKNGKGEYLAVGSRKNPNAFGFPAGKVDPSDRTDRDALAREVMEETGHSIINPRLLGVVYNSGYSIACYTCGLVVPERAPRPGEPPYAWVDKQAIATGSHGTWNMAVLRKFGL